MGRKGKEPAGPSRAEPDAQRRRVEGQEDDDGGTRIGDYPRAKLVWKTGSLEKKDRVFHKQLFADKMLNQKDPHNGFLYERVVNLNEFRAFGIVQKFEAIGWEAVLNCYDGVTDRKYMNPVMEWVGSLKYEGGRSPPKTMRLVGDVGGREVIMSHDILKEIANFDSIPDRRGGSKYLYPSSMELFDKCHLHPQWNQMISELFLLDNDGRMRRDQMKMQARLLLLIVQQNILPRRSDRGYLRHPDVQIVHSLMTGSPRISFKHLVMMNIWYSRNKVDKQIIPYCRLITALLKRQGVITPETDFHEEDIPIFNLSGLSTFGWSYVKTALYHKLKNAGKKWRALRLDAEPLDEGETDEPDSGEEEVSDEEMEDGGARAPYFGGMPNYYDTYGGYQGMEEFVVQQRPIDFDSWTSYQQASYDQNTHGFEQLHWDNMLNHNRQEHWNRTHAWNQEREVNLRWQDDQRRRMHNAWQAGEPVIEHPEIVDYTTLAPYDGTVHYPVPPVHHSPWLDPIQDEQQQQQSQGSSSDAFNFGTFSDTMRSIFGDPQNPYY